MSNEWVTCSSICSLLSLTHCLSCSETLVDLKGSEDPSQNIIERGDLVVDAELYSLQVEPWEEDKYNLSPSSLSTFSKCNIHLRYFRDGYKIWGRKLIASA